MEKLREYCSDIPGVNKVLEQKDKVAVIRMAGVIADTANMRRAGISYQKFTKLIDKAFDLKPLKAVALVINSPGGAPAQCSLITNKIRKLSEEKEIPVYAFVEDVAASGGYWIACAAEEIYVQESSVVGSIGVISVGFGFEDFIDKHNIKRRVHTAGADKSFLDPFKPEAEKDLKRLKALQTDIHDSFKKWVKARRGEKLNGTDKALMEGAFWTGTQAMEKGIVDGIGDVKTVMKDKLGEKIRFINIEPEKKLLGALPFGAGDTQNNWVQMALDTAEDRATWSRYGL
ncbi:MAG: S49 family peptidase [Pseudomonadota bacterium]